MLNHILSEFRVSNPLEAPQGTKLWQGSFEHAKHEIQKVTLFVRPMNTKDTNKGGKIFVTFHAFQYIQ